MSTAATPSRPETATARRWIAGVLLIAALAVLGRQAGGQIPRFAEWVAGLGAMGPLVFIGGYAIAVVAFVPASLLTLAAGAIFGIARGALYVFCAATLGSALAFLVSRYVARRSVEARLAMHPGFAAIDRAVAAQGRRIVFLLRLSPAFPFTLLNYALGLTQVRFGDYLLASLGMLPGTFLYVYYGKLAGDVAALAGGAPVAKGEAYYAVLLLGLLATLAVTAVVTRIARRALAEATVRKSFQETLLSARGALERAQAGERGPSISPAVTRTAGDTKELLRILDVRDGAAPAAPIEQRAATERAREEASDHQSVVAPLDDHNTKLLVRVRPTDWINPAPAARYDLVVVGAGSGGLISAAVASGLGARVALVERDLMGGDCLNFGCVPSKSLLGHARLVREARTLVGETAFDDAAMDREFAAAMEKMRRVRAEIARDDSARRYRDELGVDVFQGSARLTGSATIDVGGTTLRFRKCILATGARAAVPHVEGLRETGFLTNETVFNLVERPRRLAVIGGGPIGCELAQAMRRLGCFVTIVQREAQLLPREDADAAAILQRRFEREGIQVLLAAELLWVSRGPSGKVLRVRCAGIESEVSCDAILVATGRRANVEGLGLDAAGVECDEHGIRVDDRLRTGNRRIYAVGDCCLRWQFTHAADASAKIAVQNALFFGRRKLSSLVMPWCTYTEPGIAHVGLDGSEAEKRGIATDVFTVPLDKVNRAVIDGDADGFVRVWTRKGSDRILGATVVAAQAGDLIGELALAISGGLGLAKIAATIHPYPTHAEGIKAAANAYMRTKLTPSAQRLLALLLRVQRW